MDQSKIEQIRNAIEKGEKIPSSLVGDYKDWTRFMVENVVEKKEIENVRPKQGLFVKITKFSPEK